MQDYVFCRIARGEIEAHKIYEDDSIVAFLDLEPINPGHTLVIPKNHVDEFQDMSEDLYDHIMHNVHQISRKMKDSLRPNRVGLWVHGFEVPHAHIHVVPLEEPSDIQASRKEKPADDEMAEIAKKLSS